MTFNLYNRYATEHILPSSSLQMHVAVSLLFLTFGFVIVNSATLKESSRIKRQMPPAQLQPQTPSLPRPCINGTAPGSGEEESEIEGQSGSGMEQQMGNEVEQ